MFVSTDSGSPLTRVTRRGSARRPWRDFQGPRTTGSRSPLDRVPRARETFRRGVRRVGTETLPVWVGHTYPDSSDPDIFFIFENLRPYSSTSPVNLNILKYILNLCHVVWLITMSRNSKIFTCLFLHGISMLNKRRVLNVFQLVTSLEDNQ